MNKRILAGLGIVVVAAVGGFFVQRALTERSTLTPVAGPDASRPSTAAGNPAASNTAAGTGADAGAGPSSDETAPPQRTIPETLPAISLADRDGVSRSLQDWKGRPVIVNFWATWCGPCREEIPLLKALRNERSAERLEIIGIAIDERKAVLEYARDIGIDYPILIGEQEGYAAAEAFGVALVLPFSVFADSESRIVTLKVGELHANEAAFILDRVRDVDAKHLSLADARQQIADKMREFAVERGKQRAEEHG